MVRSSSRRTLLSALVKRSFSLAGHRTSVALEEEFWTVLLRIARLRAQTLSALVAAVDATRAPDRPLASALRVMALLASPDREVG
jgi:predicted DNA-binding ribbon-helix-helix protein